jgi:hypothetical protein
LEVIAENWIAARKRDMPRRWLSGSMDLGYPERMPAR